MVWGKKLLPQVIHCARADTSEQLRGNVRVSYLIMHYLKPGVPGVALLGIRSDPHIAAWAADTKVGVPTSARIGGAEKKIGHPASCRGLGLV